MMKLAKEPLVHFLLIGAGLFLLFEWRGTPAPTPGARSAFASTEIVVSRVDVDRLIETFTRTWQRAPTGEEVKNLVEDFVREEITYREALANGLDRGDSVIRRRMRLKMEFLFEDIASQVAPTEQELEEFLARHPESYRLDPQVRFHQVYVSADRRGEAADADARRILTHLRAGADPDSAGDGSLLEPYFDLAPIGEIQERFGNDFGNALLELDPGKWEGPLRSAFGLHLVRVEERLAPRLPALEEVRKIIDNDWAVARQQELKDAAYARLKQRYRVVVADPGLEASLAARSGGGTEAR